jgi:murein DD-endopeptidase MepM/ murein hydrolase activator NlpD
LNIPALAILVKRAFVGAGFTPALILCLILLNLAFLSAAFAQACESHVDWQSFERRVRDGKISYQDGEKAIAEWANRLGREFPQDQFQRNISFPLKAYSIRDVGGKNGDGYEPEGYRFLDGNRHQGHPAQDIFVRDRDQDGLDDLTGKPVEVLALADGVVLSTFSDWNRTDLSREIRGGNYVWIYHPALRAFSYSAHLEKVFVHPGNKVDGGEVIATLGRSGKKASLPRSPTHLHLMILSSRSMEPMDAFPLLKSSTPARSSLLAPTLCCGAFAGPARRELTFKMLAIDHFTKTFSCDKIFLDMGGSLT